MSNFLTEKNICILKSKKKKEILEELIENLAESGKIENEKKLKDAIFYREKLMSTGIGLGIAVPHVRIEGIEKPVMALGIKHAGIPDYESIDGEVIRIVVMIVAGKEQHREYIKLLSLVVSALKNKEI